MTVPHNPNQNQLLASVPPAEFRRISPHLELVPMPVGESYYESGGKLQHVYFPTSSIVSLRYVMENGAHAEIAGVGNEGMLGISVFMGDKALPRQALVRSVGFGYRLKARLLLEEFNRAAGLVSASYCPNCIVEQENLCGVVHAFFLSLGLVKRRERLKCEPVLP